MEFHRVNWIIFQVPGNKKTGDSETVSPRIFRSFCSDQLEMNSRTWDQVCWGEDDKMLTIDAAFFVRPTEWPLYFLSNLWDAASLHETISSRLISFVSLKCSVHLCPLFERFFWACLLISGTLEHLWTLTPSISFTFKNVQNILNSFLQTVDSCQAGVWPADSCGGWRC